MLQKHSHRHLAMEPTSSACLGKRRIASCMNRGGDLARCVQYGSSRLANIGGWMSSHRSRA